MSPLSGERDPGCGIGTHIADQGARQIERVCHARARIGIKARPGRPTLVGLKVPGWIVGGHVCGDKPGVAPTLDCQKLPATVSPHCGPPQGAHQCALNVRTQVVGHQEEADVLHLNGGCGGSPWLRACFIA